LRSLKEIVKQAADSANEAMAKKRPEPIMPCPKSTGPSLSEHRQSSKTDQEEHKESEDLLK
jgi:hypothetical protein